LKTSGTNSIGKFFTFKVSYTVFDPTIAKEDLLLFSDMTDQHAKKDAQPTDEEKEIINLLLRGDWEGFVFWAKMKLFPPMFSVLESNYSPTKDQIAEVYKSTLDDVVENLLDGRFRGESKLSTYFISIASKKMVRLIKKKIRDKDHMKHNHLEYEIDINKLFSEENKRILRKCIQLLSKPCNIIMLGYLEGKSLITVAEQSGYAYSHIKSSATPCKAAFKELLIKNGIEI
jgi:hypothetical protein